MPRVFWREGCFATGAGRPQSDRPSWATEYSLAASGLLELLSQQPQRSTAPGVRTTLFVPVRALEGLGERRNRATISGLAGRNPRRARKHKQWQIGVRPAGLQTVNSGALRWRREELACTRAASGKRHRQPRYRDNCC